MLHPLSDVPKETADALAVARLVVAAAANLHGDFSVARLAIETGMSIEAVREVLRSPIYQSAIQEDCKSLLMHALTRGLKKMDQIVQAEKSSDSNRIAAFRAIVTTFEAIKQKREEPPPGADLEAFLTNFGKPKIQVTPPT